MITAVVWYAIGLVGAYVGQRRAMIRMGSRFPDLFNEPEENWYEERTNIGGWFMMSLMAILGPLSYPVILIATWSHERGLK